MRTRLQISQNPQFTALIHVAHERAVKGAELTASGRVQPIAGRTFLVASSAGSAYTVDLDAGTCSCPDGRAPHDAAGRKLCKHVCAAILY